MATNDSTRARAARRARDTTGIEDLPRDCPGMGTSGRHFAPNRRTEGADPARTADHRGDQLNPCQSSRAVREPARYRMTVTAPCAARRFRARRPTFPDAYW